MSWKQESGKYPYQDTIPEPLNLFSQPYPQGLMQQKNGEYPKYTYLNPLNLLTQPYPAGIMIAKQGEYPRFQSLQLLKCGAFINSSLEQIQIPSSVKFIGEYAFYNTNLKQVTIASDCIYSDTSFPEDCVIYTY